MFLMTMIGQFMLLKNTLTPFIHTHVIIETPCGDTNWYLRKKVEKQLTLKTKWSQPLERDNVIYIRSQQLPERYQQFPSSFWGQRGLRRSLPCKTPSHHLHVTFQSKIGAAEIPMDQVTSLKTASSQLWRWNNFYFPWKAMQILQINVSKCSKGTSTRTLTYPLPPNSSPPPGRSPATILQIDTNASDIASHETPPTPHYRRCSSSHT